MFNLIKVKFHQTVDGISHFDESDIIVGPGSKELIYLTMNVLERTVILLSPAWPSYLPQAKLASKETLIIHRTFENDWKLTATQLAEALTKNPVPPKSLLVFTSPDNPSKQKPIKFKVYLIIAIFKPVLYTLRTN